MKLIYAAELFQEKIDAYEEDLKYAHGEVVKYKNRIANTETYIVNITEKIASLKLGRAKLKE